MHNTAVIQHLNDILEIIVDFQPLSKQKQERKIFDSNGSSILYDSPEKAEFINLSYHLHFLQESLQTINIKHF
ncbi:unnamed protein product [Heterobilharzia americana]|nr:unnamed protein product [Heterobilharzia americana]